MSIFRSYRTKEKVSVGLMWGINLATLLYVMIEYPNLPDIIPHHYGHTIPAEEAKIRDTVSGVQI